MSTTDFKCPHCDFAFELTPEYLAEYGGQETHCTACGKPFSVPLASSDDVFANPVLLNYAAPVVPKNPATGVWQDRGYVVYTRGKSLPRRCPKCDGAAIGKPTWLRMRFQLQQEMAIGRVARAIKAAHAEETTLAVYFCPRHHREFHLFTWLFPLIAICTLICLGIVQGDIHNTIISTSILCISLVAVIGTFLWRSVVRKALFTVAGDKRYGWLAGCCSEFVEGLPGIESAQENSIAAAAEKLEQTE